MAKHEQHFINLANLVRDYLKLRIGATLPDHFLKSENRPQLSYESTEQKIEDSLALFLMEYMNERYSAEELATRYGTTGEEINIIRDSWRPIISRYIS
jgi:hypothetical protein